MGGDTSLQTGSVKGFTLLEVMVSMALLGMVLVTLYHAYTSQVEAIQTAQQRSQIRQTARIVLERLRKDLESAFVAVPGRPDSVTLGLVGQEGRWRGGPADRLDFTTIAHLPLTPADLRTDLCEVGYSLEKDPEGEGLILIRRDDPFPDGDLTEGGHSQELCRGLTGLEFRFFDPQGTEHSQWNTLGSERAQGLPPLIRIRMTLRDGLGKEHRFQISVHPVLSGRKDIRPTNEQGGVQ